MDLVVAELVFVLQSVYKQPRRRVAQLLRATIALPAVRCEDSIRLHRTAELYESGFDFADAYLVACAEAGNIPTIVSFDRGIRAMSSVTREEP